MKETLKKIWKYAVKYGHYLDRPAKALLVIPGLRVWGLVLLVIDAFFDVAWAAEKKETVKKKIEEHKGK